MHSNILIDLHYDSNVQLLPTPPPTHLLSHQTTCSEMSGSGKTNRGASNRCPYATLNLSGPDSGIKHDPTRAQVSDDDIRDAYKKLSRLLHPDKRSPGKEREDAQEIFTELMNACKLVYCWIGRCCVHISSYSLC
jgi:hypothetical protein